MLRRGVWGIESARGTRRRRSMALQREIVITGVGVVSPIGIGREKFWSSLIEGRSGVRLVEMFQKMARAAPLGAPVTDFDPKEYVRPRKSLKVMSRDIQMGVAAADLACIDAGLRQQPLDPNRSGVVMGADMIFCELEELLPTYRSCLRDGQFDFAQWGPRAMADIYPLWMLKYLPNMPACHIGIAQDIRGPTNAIVMGEVSSLAAVIEAVRAVDRGSVDVMIAGGASSRVHTMIWQHEQLRQYSHRSDPPEAASRPFDAQRDGMVNGEGSGAFIVESREHADARGAKILARVRGFASTFEPRANGQLIQGWAISRAIEAALRDAGMQPDQIGHVKATGLSTTWDDHIEAQAIRRVLGDVPVTAPKSYFGNLGAGSGAVEMAVSVLALVEGLVPPTLNYIFPDPQCPVCVIHGRPMPVEKPAAVVLSHTRLGQAVAVVIDRG